MIALRRVPPVRQGRGAYVRPSTDNCTAKTTAAGPLSRATGNCELNRRRQTPSNAFNIPMRTTMTVPSVRPLRTHPAVQDTLDFPQTPTSDPAPLLRQALAVDLHPAAYRAYAAAVLTLPAGEAWTVAQIADAAHVSHHSARFAVSQLVTAGLLHARRMVVRDEDGTPRDGKRYFLARGEH